MKKVILIGLKDLQIAFRDRAGLILMLLAPFVLTLGMGFVTGRFSGNANSGLSDIPVIIVNQDEGTLGQTLTDVFMSAELAALLEPTSSNDLALARQQLENDEVAAVVIVPAGFTASIIPDQANPAQPLPLQIELYENPSRPVSAGLVRAILDTFLNRLTAGQVSGQVAISQLVQNGLLPISDIAAKGEEIGRRAATTLNDDQALIQLQRNEQVADNEFDTLAYLAPGMAMLFLMYTVSRGGSNILTERQEGTLARLLTTPTSPAQLLGGKIVGIYLTGVAQMVILIFASRVLFGVDWGNLVNVVILILAVVAGAAGWGLVLAALARTPNQAGSLGSALMLIFGILGGSFIPVEGFGPALRSLRLFTPNAWGLDGFTSLATGGTLADIVPALGGLLLMATILFTVAVFLFRQRKLT